MYRIGRPPDPWQLNFETIPIGERNFGSRFDDPEGRYGVLYASSSQLGCFIETLARFRKPPADVLAGLQDIQYADSDHLTLGIAPTSWRVRDEWESRKLRRTAAPIFIPRNGFPTYGENSRGNSQPINLIWTTDDTESQHLSKGVGLRLRHEGARRHLLSLAPWHRSRKLGSLEPFDFAETTTSELHADNPDFQKALQRLDLKLNPAR